MRNADGWVTIGTNLDTDQIDKQLELLYGKLERLNSEYEALESEPAYEGQAEDLMKINSEIDTTIGKIRRLVKEKDKINNPPNDLFNFMKKFEKQTERTARKIVNIGLAFIGIRSVYGFFSSSMSTLSRYNEQLAKDIEYIKFALATTLEPIILRLVQLVYKLLTYLGYIMKAWFGINIFAKAGADAMNKTSKSAKDLKKQLAGFDEMNILSDTSGTADAGAVLPSIDLSQQNIDPPQWLVWLGEHGAEIISVITGIATALALLRLGLSPLMASGIGIAVAGVVYAVVSLLDYLKEPTWENFGKIIQGIGVFVIGLGIAFLGLPAIITGVVVLIAGIIIKYWDIVKSFLQNGIDWLANQSDWVRNMFGNQVGDIYDNIVYALQMILNGFDTAFTGIKKIFDGLITFIKGVFTGNWEQAWEGVKQIFAGIFQSIFGFAQIVFGKIMAIVGSIALVIGQTISDLFKGVVNIAIGAIEEILNKPISAINGIIKVGNKIPGVNISYLTPVKFPRLAKGGIINMAGRGVNYGGANIGERGAEGVIPLTDSQQMALLGEAIGKYITINASITNTMNGRVISRELKKVQNENDFAYNR